ncbi:hypothetical protein [Nostoc sp. 2RC]|uniref:hypothetical protein n=1 Tax=Nostoc sp. 2RC TaxID=2485484 RepID=UPI0016261909|nr:hypothetical protein [Nostoc sp. 2RC]MBC1235743.1 hypothetical protein [Nostoc sp. 2RC]
MEDQLVQNLLPIAEVSTLEEQEKLKQKAKKYNLLSWTNNRLNSATAVGAISGGLPGLLGLAALSMDLMWCARVGIRGCFGVGHILNKDVDYETDATLILAIWSGIAEPVHSVNEGQIAVQTSTTKSIMDDFVLEKIKIAAGVTTGVSTAKFIDKTATKVGSKVVTKTGSKVGSKISGKIVTKVGSKVITKAGNKTSSKIATKVGGKVLTKASAKINTKIGGKIATKVNFKFLAKLGQRIGVTSAEVIIPFVGIALGASINRWLINGLLNAAVAYYTHEFVVFHDIEVDDEDFEGCTELVPVA